MFRPFTGEVITAKLISSDADGIRCMYSIFSLFLDCKYLLTYEFLVHIQCRYKILHNQLIEPILLKQKIRFLSYYSSGIHFKLVSDEQNKICGLYSAHTTAFLPQFYWNIGDSFETQ